MAKGKKKENLTPEEKLERALVPREEWPYEVPGNWCWVRLGSIASVKGGKRIPKGHTLLEYKTGHPYIRVTDMINGEIDLAGIKYISEEVFDIIHNYTISKDDVYISVAGSIGKIGIVPDCLEGANLTENAAKITEIACSNNVFLKYYLQSNTAQLQMQESTISTTQPKLALFRIENIAIPLPPINEQNRIVEQIEKLFSKLDEAKEKAQEALDGFEERKAAILHKAFSGELTEKWREENNININDWKELELIDVLVDKPRNGYSPKPVDYETPYKSMTLSATTSGVFKPEYYKFIDEKIDPTSYLWLKPGDILIQRANSLDKVGTSAIYTGKEHEFIYPDLMMKLQVQEGVVAEYIAYQLKTEKVMNFLKNNATGTAGNMPKINQKVVAKVPIVLPENSEQQMIVNILDDIFDKEKMAKDLAESVINEIETMKKSILAKAFRGELGTNDLTEESSVELIKNI